MVVLAVVVTGGCGDLMGGNQSIEVFATGLGSSGDHCAFDDVEGEDPRLGREGEGFGVEVC